jgi:hypothetical protein
MNDYEDAEFSTPDEEPEPERPAPLPVVQKDKPNLPAKPEEPTTAAQARTDAVAHLTMSAYALAGQLPLTEDERRKLIEPFPDDDFRSLELDKQIFIYLEHASLRMRLNQVLGIGQWALIQRSRTAQSFKQYKRSGEIVDAVHVFAECMLVIRGGFAGEATGEMTYYPANQSTHYGDCVEGAKSAALRLCCKELGIGLQAWDKAFQKGWLARNTQGNKPSKPRERQPGEDNGGDTAPAQPPIHPEVARWIPDIEQITSVDGARHALAAWQKIEDKLVRTEVWQLLCRRCFGLNIVYDRDLKDFFHRPPVQQPQSPKA